MNNDPIIPRDKVVGFRTRADAEDFMAEYPDRILGAVHFTVGPDKKLDYMLQSSSQVLFGGDFCWGPRVAVAGGGGKGGRAAWRRQGGGSGQPAGRAAARQA
jgi:hypothetical protein